MLKALKKICISIVVLCICISPLSQKMYGTGIVQASGTQTPTTDTPKTVAISRERICSTQEAQHTGCEWAVHVGNVTYTHYYQFIGDYANDILTFFNSKPTMHKAGCGVTACASILTGYGKKVTPRDIATQAGSSFSIASTMSKNGVPGRWYNGKKTSEFIELVEKAFSEGKPVIANMKNSIWTSGDQHFVPIVGQDANYMWTCDPGTSAEYRHKYSGKVSKAASSMRGVWIPNSAPSGSNAGEAFVPSGDNGNSGGGSGGSHANGEGNPDITPKYDVTWEITNEIPDMDNLGYFKYNGNPKNMEMSTGRGKMEWVFKQITNFLDYILGMIFTVVKIAIVGTIENIDNMINGILLQIEQTNENNEIIPLEEIEEEKHYTIEDIVYNRVPALDPNILSGTAGGMELNDESTLGKIRTVIASWYVGFRNVSILIIFVMLIYTGLRMAITNVAQAKADFKKQLFTWIKCMVLIFTLHYVIFIVLNLNNSLVNIFDPSNTTSHENVLYNTIKTRAYDLRLSVGFTGTVMYIVLFIYWIKFLLIYIKRLLKIVLLIVTAPFVIARYALDNATGKGKKAYTDWMRNLITNVFIQSLHALEYTVLIGISVDLGSKSISGFIIALIFMSQMLKFDEIILSIIRFGGDGEDTGGRIRPLKEPLHLDRYLKFKYAQNAIRLTGKAVKTVGRGVKVVNDEVFKDIFEVDPLGAIDSAKNGVLNTKDNILKNTVGHLSDELKAEYDLRIDSREKDKEGNYTKRAQNAKRTLKSYKKEKKKCYKAQRKQFVGKSRVLSTAAGIGKFTIGTALMTQNLAAGMMMAGLTPGEIRRSIMEHDKRKEEYEKNKQKIDELGETIKDVNTSNRLEDEIEDKISGMDEEDRKKALKELMKLSSLNGNKYVVEDAIKDYMTRHNIKMINNDNVDEILEATFETIDPNKTLTAQQRKEFVEELKKNLKVKRESEWMSLTKALDRDSTAKREQAGTSSKGQDERTDSSDTTQGRQDRRTNSRDETQGEQDRRETERFSSDRRKTERPSTDRRATERETADRRTRKRDPRVEAQFEQSHDVFVSSFTREDVSNMFSQTIQDGIVSKENQPLGQKINEMQDINYKSMKRSKKKVNNTNKFIGQLRNRYK